MTGSGAEPTAVLLIACPDRRGLVAAVAGFVQQHGGNVVDADQHLDTDEDGRPMFFQRVEFALDGFDLQRDEIGPAFAEAAEPLGMRFELRFTDHRPRVALLASKSPHCLFDLLTRARTGELAMDVPLVVANHPDHEDVARFFGATFEHLPVTADTKADVERRMLELFAEHRIDLVVLARYMQVLTGTLIEPYRHRIINIHHSFLPAFAGGRPYQRAHDRGVKVIGATAHYATEDLDEGPIIEQDVARVSHRDSVEDLTRVGRDLETVVLARAVRAHVEHRVLVSGRRTIVFG